VNWSRVDRDEMTRQKFDVSKAEMAGRAREVFDQIGLKSWASEEVGDSVFIFASG